MIFALINGSLWRSPEQKTSKSGRDFVAGTLRFKDAESFQFVRFVAFSETAQAELLRLGDGDSVSVQGSLKVELYQPEGGEPKVSLSIVADHVMALRQPKERKAQKERETPYRGGAGAFDDSIPFGAP